MLSRWGAGRRHPGRGGQDSPVRALQDLQPGPGEQRRYLPWTGLCLTVLLGLATADLLLGQDSVAGTLAVPPVMASVLATRRQTATVGVASLLGAALLSAVDDAPLPAALLRIGAVLAAAALAVWAAGLRNAREQRLAHLTRVAAVAQNAILLPVPPRTGPLALAARYRSATHNASIGGPPRRRGDPDRHLHHRRGRSRQGPGRGTPGRNRTPRGPRRGADRAQPSGRGQGDGAQADARPRGGGLR